MRAEIPDTSFYGEGFPHFMQDDFLGKVLTQIDGVRLDLPGWFKLENYRYLEFSDLTVWYEQLLIRKTLIYQKFSNNNLGMDFKLKELEASIRSKGIASIQEHTDLLTVGGTQLLQARTKKSGDMAVQFLSSMEMVARLCSFSKEDKHHLIDILSADNYVEALKIMKGYDVKKSFPLFMPLHPEQNYIVELNKHATTAQILDALEKQLKQIDRKWPKNNGKSKAQLFDPKKLFGLRSIPYIDLAIYAFENKGNIPYPVLAEALYPMNPEKSEGNISDSVRPRAIELLTFASLEKLYSQLSFDPAFPRVPSFEIPPYLPPD